MAGRERIVDKVSCLVDVEESCIDSLLNNRNEKKGGLVIYRDRHLAFHPCSLTYALTHG